MRLRGPHPRLSLYRRRMRDDVMTPTLSAPAADAAVTLLERLYLWVLDHGIRVVVIVVLAAIAMAVARKLIHRFFNTMITSSTAFSTVTGAVIRRDRRAQKAAQARREQRATTLSNVMGNVASAVIATVATIMILSELGVDIAPVIASLGVAGLAAGIGAQTIIKDVISGVLMLFEDIVAVGDYVDLQFAEGTVENINLRATQVRSVDGVLWTVRNGEIIRIGNYQRGFSIAKIEFNIDGTADNTKVTEVLERVCEEIYADATWSELIIDDKADVSGILDVDGARVKRRILIKTLPGEQWGLEREVRRRVRAEFREAGIDFALPRFGETAPQ